MGMMQIRTWGSFPANDKTFSAMERGHAHAVAEAIAFLSNVVLPEAIERDHRLHEKGAKPTQGFDRAGDAS